MDIRKEDLELVKKNIEDKKKIRNEYLSKIKTAKEDNIELNKTRDQIESITRETDAENEHVVKKIEEIKNLILIYQKGDPEGKKRNHQLKKQLASLENTLANGVKTFEDAQRNQDILELQLKQISQQDDELTSRVKKLEKAVHTYHNYRKNFPKCSSTILHVVDLESHLHFYSTQIISVRNSVKCQMERIEKLKKSISNKEKQLVDLQSELQSINNSIQSNEAVKNDLYTDLQNYNSQFEVINNERKKADDQFHNLIEQNRQSDINSIGLRTRQREKLIKLNNEISRYPSLIKQLEKDNEEELKRKQDLIAEIKKKIEAAIYEIRIKNSNSPQMLKQIQNLEKQWREHDNLFNNVQTLEKKLYASQDLLQRKKMILEETRRQVVKKVVKPGIQYLLEFYEEEHLENKRLEMKIIKVNRDLEIYKAENVQYLRELNEIS